jgi:hypothetical protein
LFDFDFGGILWVREVRTSEQKRAKIVLAFGFARLVSFCIKRVGLRAPDGGSDGCTKWCV